MKKKSCVGCIILVVVGFVGFVVFICMLAYHVSTHVSPMLQQLIEEEQQRAKAEQQRVDNALSTAELYDQLCRNRLALQQDIQKEIDEYRKIGMEVLKLREQVRRNIGNRPFPIVIQMFQRNEMPPDLQLAHSYWNGLVNAEALQSIIKNLLDNYQKERTLEQMDNEIAFLDREMKLEQHGLIDENRIATIKSMIGLQLDSSKRITKGLSEQEIIERQIRESNSW